MAIDRIKGAIAFECDGPGCHEGVETGENDFSVALEETKDRGWKVRQYGGAWKHFCSQTCLDAFESKSDDFSRIKIKPGKPKPP